MTLRYSVELRNAGINARVNEIGSWPTLKIFAEAPPEGGTKAADPEELLIAMRLPKKWMEEAKDGHAAKSGAWNGTASADGVAQSFRIYSSDGSCHMQGGIPSEMELLPSNKVVK